MPTEPEVLSLSAAARRAAEVVDPDGEDALVGEWLERFEDRDEPITAVGDLETQVAEACGIVDPEGEEPVIVVAGAIVTYLGFRRDAIGETDDRLLRLASDAELGDPSPAVRDWLVDAGLPDPA
ncbi:hypothetical protein [Conexibacter sp. SYSU D00693]|uniref:hypothetical protein n=1 Tax=Conexibacter sp. SYSU D00693 TaxID=2812560 RepID=UPI00196A8850|nr:hypothetical protein [Conexibacter sp. SYSU D00693]